MKKMIYSNTIPKAQIARDALRQHKTPAQAAFLSGLSKGHVYRLRAKMVNLPIPIGNTGTLEQRRERRKELDRLRPTHTAKQLSEKFKMNLGTVFIYTRKL